MTRSFFDFERFDVVKRSIPVARLDGIRTRREDQGANEVDLDSGWDALGVVDDGAERDVLGERDLGEELAEDDASVLRDTSLGKTEERGEVRDERVEVAVVEKLLGGVGEQAIGEDAGAEEVTREEKHGVQIAVAVLVGVALEIRGARETNNTRAVSGVDDAEG